MSGDPPTPTRIFLRPLGSPLTLGMSGLTVASVVASGLDLAWISAGQRHEVGYILMSVPFALQLIACVFAYLSRDGAAGATLGVLSLTWFAMGLIDATSPAGARSGALGLLLLASGAVLLLSSVAVTLAKPLPGLAFALAATRFGVTGIYLLGATDDWRRAGGIIGLVVAGIAGYGVLAFELEGQQGRPVLPTFRVGHGRAALARDAPARIERLSREPGVRQTT